MPNWSNHPPITAEKYAFSIRRTPAAKAIDAIVTSDDILGCYTHFVHHRTIPCEGPPNCPHCAEGHSYRWHGYVSAILCATYEHFLFEFTPIPAATLTNYRDLHGTLRACRIKAYRPSQRQNGRVVITCKMHDEQHARLPKPPDIPKILCHIWNIQSTKTNNRHDPKKKTKNLIVPPAKGDGRYRPETPGSLKIF